MPTRNHSQPLGTSGQMSGLLEGESRLNGNGTSSRHLASGGADKSGAGPNGGGRCKNRILAALAEDAWARLGPPMRRVLLHQGDTLQESGAPVEHIYFVESGLISIVADTREGAQVEVGVTGMEGVVGVMSMIGNQPSLHRMIVQLPGNGYRLPIALFQEEHRRNPELQDLLHHYLYVLMAQASQSALCNRTHTVEERLSRWLLTVRDRVQSDELDLTHEFVAHMLGVRRSGVTVALGILQQSGLIDISRGHITLTDPEKLQCCACDCYEIMRQQFQMFESKTAV